MLQYAKKAVPALLRVGIHLRPRGVSIVGSCDGDALVAIQILSPSRDSRRCAIDVDESEHTAGVV